MKNFWEIKNNRLFSLIVFINGAIILSIEIVGAKTIAPYLGTSVYVWTAIIGVILGSLAAGYWYGGIVADRKASILGLSKIFTIAALILSVTTILQTPILNIISEAIPSLRIQAGFASLILFAPTTFFLGMVTPYVVKLALHNLKQTGETVGKLDALATFGSITGTFLTGYYLINYIGIKQLYWIYIALIIILATICYLASGKTLSKKTVASFMLISSLFLALSINTVPNKSVVYAKDTSYASYRVEERIYKDKLTRLLITDSGGSQSGMIIDEPNTPAFKYVEMLIELVGSQENEPNKILMIGGGTYTLPTILHGLYPDMQIEVVEIDPELDEIAYKFFNYKPTSMINIIHEDGRTYLNQTSEKYDMVIFDAYNSLRPPSHLMTTEALVKTKNLLNENGLIASNIIGSTGGARSEFTSSVEKTMANNFENVSIFFTNKEAGDNVQNLLYVASDYSLSVPEDFQPAEIKSNQGIILKDNYAPTERMLGDY